MLDQSSDNIELNLDQDPSYFQKLYWQKRRDLQSTQQSLLQQLLSCDFSGQIDEEIEESELINQGLLDQINVISKTLQIPQSQVTFQAQTNPIGFSKMFDKARRQSRREKAKNRVKNFQISNDLDSVKQEECDSKSKIGQTSTTQSSSGDELAPQKILKNHDGSGKRKRGQQMEIPESGELTKRQIQMIRNRISAQNSRDKKKNYMQNLEQDQNRLLAENKFQKERIDYLEKQLQISEQINSGLQIEIQELRQQAFKPEANMICFDCKSKNVVNDVEYYENVPTLQIKKQNSTNLSKIGLAFFTVFTILALVAYPMNDKKNAFMQNPDITVKSRLLQQQFKELSEQCIVNENIKTTSRVINYDDEDYKLFHKVSELRQENTPQHLVEFGSKLLEPIGFQKNLELPQNPDEPIVSQMIRQNKKLHQQQQVTQLAPLNYFEKENQVSTIFCPNTYQYSDFSKAGIKVTFQNNKWIQLMVPRENISLFYENWNDRQIVIMDGSEQDIKKDNRTQLTEVWCQVKQVNEIFMD